MHMYYDMVINALLSPSCSPPSPPLHSITPPQSTSNYNSSVSTVKYAYNCVHRAVLTMLILFLLQLSCIYSCTTVLPTGVDTDKSQK